MGYDLARLNGAQTDANAITSRLQEVAQHCHLVSPATSCAHIPEGFAVQMSAVQVTDDECYDPGGGKRALGKTAIQRIAAAAGLSWIPQMSGRLDDGRDPYFVHYRAVGRYRHFDGSEIVVQGEKIMDLRDGSPTAAYLKPGELSMQRRFILEHAETKARLRATRSMGLRTAYRSADLAKPFVVAKLAFTGQSDDPVLRRRFAEMGAAAALGATNALYGPSTAAALPHVPTPPVEETPLDEDPDERTDETTGEITQGKPVPQTSSAPNAPSAGTTSNGGPGSGRRSASPASVGRLVPAGFPGAGKSIEALDLETLKDLRAKVQAFIEAKRAEKVPEEKLAAVTAFLGDVELRMDALRPPAGPAPSDPEMDEWQRDYDAAGNK